jgi:hypothetical protein
VLALHISNRYLDLEPAAAALAGDAGVACLAQSEPRRAAAGVPGKLPSRWVVMAAHRRDLGRLGGDPRWHACRGDVRSVWTDDFSNLVGALKL